MSDPEIQNVADFIVIPVLAALSFYYLMVYWGRRKYITERYNLYFSLFIFFVAADLFIGLPVFLSSDSGRLLAAWLPPLEGFIILGVFFSFTNFFSRLLNLPASKKKLLWFAFYFLTAFLCLTLLSPLVDWMWYTRYILNYVIYASAIYILFISYMYSRWILQNKLYKDRILKIIIAGIFILIFYLLFTKFVYINHPRTIMQIYNFIVIVGVIYLFAYALVTKFNIEFDELNKLKLNLEEKIIERTAELSEAKEEIENINRERSEFFINLAHETRTPLTIISNYLQKYINKHSLDDELKIVKVNMDKLTRDMINFLDLEKLIKGQLIFDNNQVVNFSELLNEKVSILREYARNKNQNFSVRIDNKIYIKADPYLIDRIIFNLVDNAIKYTPVSGDIDVTLTKSEDKVIFKVKDSGQGISSVKLPHIFEPYYQVSHKKLNAEGMGMGLFILKKGVDLLNGSINVESQEDKGSTFTVKFPYFVFSGEEKVNLLKTEDILMPVQTIIKKDTDPEKKNILIVEDNIDMLNYLTEELSLNYNIITATNGIEAIKKLSGISAPALIISDIMMDVMDGEEFYNKIVINDCYQYIPFIFLTARTQQDNKIKMLQSGVVDYIYKPFDIDELLARIKTIIANAEAQKRQGLKKAIEVISREIKDPAKPPLDKKALLIQKCKKLSLTERQQEIILLISDGLESKEIANSLNISYKTVNRHIENLYSKLGVHNKIDLLNLLS